MRGLFVTGTDTGVGKTALAGAVVAGLRAAGVDAVPHKPALTGLDDPPAPGEWPPDHELLARAAGGAVAPSAVAPVRLGVPASPHLAAAVAGHALDPAAVVAATRSAAAGAEAVVVEGAGGLLVPLTAAGWSMRDLARDLGLPLLVAARPGLGTINHTLLTLEAARAAGLEVAAVVLGPWPAAPSAIEEDNRATIARLGAVEVATLPRLAGPEPAVLAAAGAALPLTRWLARSDRPGS